MVKNFKYQTFSAYACLIFAQVMVGTNIVGAKYLVTHIPFLFILTLRFSLAAVMLFVLHVLADHHPRPIRRHLEKLTKKDWIHALLQALTAGVLFNFLMVLGLRYTNANVAGIITSGLPAIIVVMSWIVLKEHFDSRKSLSVGLATIGLLVISGAKFSGDATLNQSMLGNLLVFLSLLPEAIYYVLSKMHVIVMPVLLLSAVLNLINALVMLPILFFYMDWSVLHMVPFDWLILLAISISSALFFVFWYLGSSSVDSVMASLSTAIMPVATVIIAWLTLGEVITWVQLLGMGLVVGSIFVCAL